MRTQTHVKENLMLIEHSNININPHLEWGFILKIEQQIV